ncbi:MAG TPA: HIT domain-containing protein, partial [Nitrospirae bacterium]|nr:HIT domain-containing protein [Nitrospirota bacterium]
MDCLFCKIVKGEIPAKVIYEDEKVLVFEDINPQAPVHTLVIPKKHISTLLEITGEDNELIGYLFQVANR